MCYSMRWFIKLTTCYDVLTIYDMVPWCHGWHRRAVEHYPYKFCMAWNKNIKKKIKKNWHGWHRHRHKTYPCSLCNPCISRRIQTNPGPGRDLIQDMHQLTLYWAGSPVRPELGLVKKEQENAHLET